METIYLNATDGVTLNGIIYKSEETKKVVISMHGMATNCIKKREEEIAKKLNSINIDYLTFNNRGHDIINYSKRQVGENKENFLGGTAYEIFNDCYYDIEGAIKYSLSEGYKDIYLLGHSLGSTKIVYAYNRFKKENSELLRNINGILLLSLIDIQFAQKIYLGDKYKNVLSYAEKLELESRQEDMMPNKSFIYPICVRNYLRYFRDNEDINFAQYTNIEYDFKELNNINIPLFMRWGNQGELIFQNAKELSSSLQQKIKNSKLDIGYIEGANHNYTNKEDILAEEIKKFMQKI